MAFKALSSETDPVVCPNCGFPYTHISGLRQDANPNDSPRLFPRGDRYLFDAWCEDCPNTFVVVLAQHKGQIYIGTEGNC
jgi:hypothetical protein